jgi:hypothetical protein
MSKTFQNGRALVIGVGKYEFLNSLGSAPVSDADDVAKLLTSPAHCGYPVSSVQVLRDGDVSRATILDGLKRLAAHSQAGDTVVVYFSGHGAQFKTGTDAGTYLCPPEFDIYKPLSTGIEAEELSELLNQISAGRLLVLVDACHSGAAASLKGGSETLTKWAFGGPKLDALAQGKGRVIISASASEESAVILPKHRNSLFTEVLLKGLQGAVDDRSDGLIRVLDLFHYLSETVRAAYPKQNPILTTRTQDNFPVSLRKGGLLKSAETQAVEPPEVFSADPRELEDLLVSLYPQGPLDQEIWSRAGGDIATLKLGSSGRAAWHSALRILNQGGGGANISHRILIAEALSDFGSNQNLQRLIDKL